MENNTTTPVEEEKVPAKKTFSAKLKEAVDAVPKERKMKVLKLCGVIALILLITNPALIPFLPAELKYLLVGAMSSLFGNVTDISSVLPLNWIMVFKMILMVLMMIVIKEVCQFLLEGMKPKTGRGKTILNVVKSTFSYLIVGVGIFWGLSILGVDIATLFASIGVLALIVGFGAESLIADMVTGLFMIFENEYNVGDIVEVSGFRGTVTDIGIRTTSVTDSGGNVKVFNNSDMRNIVNLSNLRSFAICDFPIPYEVRIEDAEKVLQDVFDKVQKQYPDVFEIRPVYEGVQALALSGVTLRISADVDECHRFTAARILNRELKNSMEDAGIICPHSALVVKKPEK